jgi:hypothetical protein
MSVIASKPANPPILSSLRPILLPPSMRIQLRRTPHPQSHTTPCLAPSTPSTTLLSSTSRTLQRIAHLPTNLHPLPLTLQVPLPTIPPTLQPLRPRRRISRRPRTHSSHTHSRIRPIIPMPEPTPPPIHTRLPRRAARALYPGRLMTELALRAPRASLRRVHERAQLRRNGVRERTVGLFGAEAAESTFRRPSRCIRGWGCPYWSQRGRGLEGVGCGCR